MKYIFIIQAFAEITEVGQLSDVTEIELVDTKLVNALKRAKEIYPAKNYRVRSIIEFKEPNGNT